MKEKILEAIKNFGGNVIGSGEFSALAEFIHSQIADGLGAATNGSVTGKPQFERDKEAGGIRSRFPNGSEKQKWLWIYFIEDGKRLVDIGFVTHGDFLDN